MNFRQLFESHHKKLRHYAYNIVKNYEQAEDIMMIAFEKLYLEKDHQNPEAFLQLVVKNQCIDYLRRKKKEKRGEAYLLKNSETDIDYIEAKMIKTELYHKILKESQSLTPARSKIFRMIFLEELTVQEVSDLIGISIDTIWVLKMQALNDIKYSLGVKEKPQKDKLVKVTKIKPEQSLVKKKRQEKREFVISYLKDHPISIDIMNMDFVEKYIEKFHSQMSHYGCRRLAKLLKEMFDNKLLNRKIVTGYPKWIYSYELSIK